MAVMSFAGGAGLPSVLAIALLLVAAILVIREVRAWRRLSHVPGPYWAAFGFPWHMSATLSGRYADKLRAVSNKYGDLVRIDRNTVLCSDPAEVRAISAARSRFTKGGFYATGRMVPGKDNIVTTTDDAAHKVLRGKIFNSFTGKEHHQCTFEPGLDRQVTQLIKLLDTKYSSSAGSPGPVVDFGLCAQFFALDAISDLSYSEAFGFLARDEDLYDFVKITDESMPAMDGLSAVPWMSNVLYSWPFNLALPKNGDKSGFGCLMGLMLEIVEKRLGRDAKPHEDMLQGFIKHGMTRDELTQHLFVQTIAGSITTAEVLRTIFLSLATCPPAYARLQHEIDAYYADPANEAAAGHGSATRSFEATRTALPYVHAVIRECLRTCPPVTGLGSKQVPPGGATVCGVRLPAGTQVGGNFLAFMRRPQIWGDDADLFRPERWLPPWNRTEHVTGASAPAAGSYGEEESWRAAEKTMLETVDLAFGSGKYECVGKKVALMELSKALIEIVRRFDFALAYPQEPVQVVTGTFRRSKGILLRFSRRPGSPVP